MINDFLNKSPVFKPSIGVNLNQQRLFPRSAGERRRRRTGREKDLLERRKAEGKKKKKKKPEEEDKEGSNNADRGLLFQVLTASGRGDPTRTRNAFRVTGLETARARPFTKALPLAAAGTQLPTCSQALALAALTAERLFKKKKKKFRNVTPPPN